MITTSGNVSMLQSPYERIFSTESISGGGETFGMHIEVTGTNLPDMKDDRIQNVVYKAAQMIRAEIGAVQLANDDRAKCKAEKAKEGILGCFPSLIYVEEIPNGYCRDYCCRHLPWFVVTTTRGRIKIGWRKRVIAIDWSECPDTGYANHMFSGENVTMGARDIHAWGYDKAKQYLDAILASKAPPPEEWDWS